MMLALLVAGAQLALSRPGLGTADAACRPGETGPAIAISVRGLKDREGLLRAELYPDSDADFLADDNVLLAHGKTFRRVDLPLPAQGPITLCVRAPSPGTYTLALLHDRDGDRKFSIVHDGVGFPGNPRLGWSRPPAAAARITVGTGVTTIAVTLEYRRGLFAFGPVGK